MDEKNDELYNLYVKKRIEKLGYRPQKEIFCNNYLPYADQIDEESERLLVTIKDNLAKAVAMREMKPAIGSQVKRLQS